MVVDEDTKTEEGYGEEKSVDFSTRVVNVRGECNCALILDIFSTHLCDFLSVSLIHSLVSIDFHR